MNIILTIAAILLLALCAISVVVMPFKIGHPREPYSADDYVGSLIGNVLIVLLCGRILNLW